MSAFIGDTLKFYIAYIHIILQDIAHQRFAAPRTVPCGVVLGAIDVVVVYKLDRLSRSQKDTLMLIEDKFLAKNVNGFLL